MAYIRHGSLTASTVAEITLPDQRFGKIEVTNRSGDAEIYFIVLADTDPDVEPTVEGDDCEVLPAAISALEVNAPDPAPVVVKLVSDGTPDYSIRAD
jgi:hypothetical protein